MGNDYIDYIDFSAMKLADLAYRLGDYKCADLHYNKVYARLSKYQGDATAALFLATSVRDKIDSCKQKYISSNRQIFRSSNWLLSKSSFVKGRQCSKYLFLDKYKRKLADPIGQETKALFKQGVEFEKFVRDKFFPNGINITDEVGIYFYFDSYTSYLQSSTPSVLLYEATIIEYQTLVMCDILIQDNSGDIHIYEIKGSHKFNSVFEDDLAIQYAVCKKRFGNRLKSFHLILKSEETEMQDIDLTDRLELRIDGVLEEIKNFTHIIENKEHEPDIATGAHCSQPYDCFFKGYCAGLINSRA